MNTLSTIIEIVQNLGFPIAVCGACFWYINKQADRHRDESAAMTDALNNNTLAITKLADKLEVK